MHEIKISKKKSTYLVSIVWEGTLGNVPILRDPFFTAFYPLFPPLGDHPYAKPPPPF